jgi:hypothetical protein
MSDEKKLEESQLDEVAGGAGITSFDNSYWSATPVTPVINPPSSVTPASLNPSVISTTSINPPVIQPTQITPPIP